MGDMKFIIPQRIELMTANPVMVYEQPLAKGNSGAHVWQVTVTKNGRAFDLTGMTVGCYAVRSDGKVKHIGGRVSGCVAEVEFPQAFYASEGKLLTEMDLADADGHVVTTASLLCRVKDSRGSTVIEDVGSELPSVETMQAWIDAMKTATADGLAAAQEARNAGAQAIADANAAGDAAKATAQGAADDATAAAETARATIYTRAMAIPDESALAASHELHAQRDYPLNVAVHGYTYQEGTGDPSPENVRPIRGMGLNKTVVMTGNPEKEAWLLGDWTEGYKRAYISNVFTEAASWDALFVPGYALASSPLGKNPNKPVVWMHSDALNQFNIVAPASYWTALGVSDNTSLAAWIKSLAENGNPLTVYYATADSEKNYFAAISAGSDGAAAGEVLPLLPDNSTLMEGDTVENWVRSGCDKKITFAEGDDLTLPDFDAAANVVYSDTTANITVTDGAITTTLTYPATVYYRSTDYTPDKDLRVCRVVRKYYTHEFDGTESAPISIIQGTQRFTIDINGKPGIYNNGFCTHFIESAATIGVNNVNNAISCYNTSSVYLRADMFATTSELQEFFVQQKANGTPVTYTYKLATPEIYMTDPLPLLPPAALESETVTVTASGETEVEYAHETKHYVDSQIAAAVALALNG